MPRCYRWIPLALLTACARPEQRGPAQQYGLGRAATAPEIAAVVVDPLSNRMGFIPPAPGFLDHVRRVTRALGILVIFDEDPGLSLIETIAPFGVKVAIDRDGSSVLSRIVAGFKATHAENCLVVPSSAPFIKPNVIFQLFESVRGFDAAVPRWRSGKIEPLLAAYNKKAFLRAAARSKKKKVLGSVVEKLSAISYVDVEKFLKPLDPELYSFFRVKDERDLRKARRIAQSRPR